MNSDDPEVQGLLVDLGVGHRDASGMYHDGDAPFNWREFEAEMGSEEGKTEVALMDMPYCYECGSTDRGKLLPPCSDPSDRLNPDSVSPGDWHFGGC